MSGLSDFMAKALLNYVTGNRPMPVLPGGAFPTYAAGNYTSAGVWLALMTAVDTDVGTGGTEVSGGSYARVQVAGFIDATASFTSGVTTVLTVATIPSWVSTSLNNGVGMNVFDANTGLQVGTILTWVTTTLTLTATASSTSSGAADRLIISAFSPATASAPSTITNNTIITFPTATGSWGTVIAFELRDASASGNLIVWDYLGNFSWLPTTITSASPGVFTAKAHGYSNGDSFQYSTEYGGTAPSFSSGNYTGLQTVAGSATDSFQVTGVNTSSTGSGMVRKVTQQSVPNGVTVSYAASALTAVAA